MRGVRREVSRRHFLATAAAAASGLAMPSVIPASALGRGRVAPPSERIRLGLIGCGNHAMTWNLPQIFRCPDVQIVAVCDVDQDHMADVQKAVDRHYSARFGKDHTPCATYGDFRELILRDDLDAIDNITPDHWHVIPAIMAARTGKDVICEKPLTLFLDEGKALCQAVAANNRVFQTASENRSIGVYLRIVELVRGGAIGTIRHIEVGVPTGNNDTRIGPEYLKAFNQREVQPVPPGLDYDTWLGQAPALPYIPARLHGSFRWNLAFSGGVICDWGAHMLDLAQWGHDTEHTGPVEVEGQGDFPPRDAVFNTTPTFELKYKYADGVTMGFSTQGPLIRFEGSDGWVESRGWRAPLAASDPEILATRIDPDAVKIYHPSEIEGLSDGGKGGEHRNFYDCVKSRRPTYAPAETGHRTISIAHIGNIAMMLNRKLNWDPDAERFIDDAEADAMLTRAQREPWTIANIDKWI
jgi:predicted dehydrogenase